jgi:hypothetical protein
MQAVSTDLAIAVRDVARRPVAVCEACWDGANWVDESAYLVSHEGALRLAANGDEFIPAGDVGTATIVLRNTDGRFSWKNTTGALYGYIGGAKGLFGLQVRIWQGFLYGDVQMDLSVVTIFTGVVFFLEG